MPVALISGLGLMGGSLAGALSAAGWQVVLHHRRPEVALAAAERGWGTAISSLEQAPGWDVAVAAVPVGCIPELVSQLASCGDGVITDLGSTKAAISAQLAELGARGRFVGGHPLCGSHLQGLENADPTLYQGAPAVVTPHPSCPEAATAAVTELWSAAGCVVRRMSPDEHDTALAQASHVPHVLASLCASQISPAYLDLAATGFRDTSRVAAGSPELWRDILADNRREVLNGIERCQELLGTLHEALAAGEDTAVENWLTTAQDRRQAFSDKRTCPPPDTR